MGGRERLKNREKAQKEDGLIEKRRLRLMGWAGLVREKGRIRKRKRRIKEKRKEMEVKGETERVRKQRKRNKEGDRDRD